MNISHKDHDHDSTPAAREICRNAMKAANAYWYMDDLNDFAADVHQEQVRMGFYEEGKVRDFDGMLANMHGELSEALQEWRNGRGITETYWSWKPEAVKEYRTSDPWIKVEDGQTWVKNDQWDSSDPTHFGDPGYEPEWIELTPQRLRGMPNAIALLKPEGIPSEFADLILRVLDTCGAEGIDIAGAIADKMAYNATRPYRHGGRRS